MTKQQQSDSKHRLSKICRWILAIGAFKLAALAALAMLPPDQLPFSLGIFGHDQTAQTEIQQEKPQDTAVAAVTGTIRGQVAYAAEMPTEKGITPPAPKIRPSHSLLAELPEGAENRPDAVAPAAIPAPTGGLFVPRDTALRKQEELNRREQELIALQQQMQGRLDELKTLESKIQDMLKQADNVQDDKLRHLVDVYSNMKAKQAADVLSTLDERISVRILAGMRGKQAGEILTYMRPEPAAKLSELLSRTQLPQ